MKPIGDVDLEWNSYTIEQKGDSYRIQFSKSSMDLTQLQYQYFLELQHHRSIKSLVQNSLRSGWLVNFDSLMSLLEKGVKCGGLSQRRVYQYIMQNEAEEVLNLGSEFKSLVKSTLDFFSDEKRIETSKFKPEEISRYPFFRVLSPELKNEFVSRVKYFEVKKGQKLLARGSQGRDLFLVRQGSVGVFGGQDGQALLATLNEGSVFGELGFLFGSERRADVFTLEPSTIARIKFDPVFGLYIREEKANVLKERFWVIHALLKSEIFSNLPEDLFDRLIFLGEPVSLTPGQVLFKEGDAGSEFFLIIQGELAFYQNKQFLRMLSQGQIFGEVALFISGGVRTASVLAKEKSLILKIKKNDFYNFLAEDPRSAAQIQRTAESRFHHNE